MANDRVTDVTLGTLVLKVHGDESVKNQRPPYPSPFALRKAMEENLKDIFKTL